MTTPPANEDFSWLDFAPGWARIMYTKLMHAITTQGEAIMAAVQVEQTDLDTLATNLEAAKTALSDEIAALQVKLPDADLSGLNKALSDLQGLEPPAPTPAP